MWKRTAEVHSKTNLFLRRLDRAKSIVSEALGLTTSTACMWSGGKDSTAMAHLISMMSGSSVELVSEKDDLDYPGEEEYVTRLAQAWGAPLDIVRPPLSPVEWIKLHASEIMVDADFHSRSAGMSKECFYGVVEEANASRDCIFLGLRAEESRARLMNRKMRGTLYRKKPSKWNPSGLTVCTPLADWRGLDVFAYCASNGIDVMDVYKCVGFAHANSPWLLRKSWWIPGAHTAQGSVAWLHRYYPSLYRKLYEWFPETSIFG